MSKAFVLIALILIVLSPLTVPGAGGQPSSSFCYYFPAGTTTGCQSPNMGTQYKLTYVYPNGNQEPLAVATIDRTATSELGTQAIVTGVAQVLWRSYGLQITVYSLPVPSGTANNPSVQDLLLKAAEQGMEYFKKHRVGRRLAVNYVPAAPNYIGLQLTVSKGNLQPTILRFSPSFLRKDVDFQTMMGYAHYVYSQIQGRVNTNSYGTNYNSGGVRNLFQWQYMLVLISACITNIFFLI